MDYQICKRCILDTNLPGIHFNEEGLCNICVEHERQKTNITDGRKKDFMQLVKKDKKRRDYDCLCLYSGGKDSTYMLYTLVKKYNLKVLAFTLDNWFISKETFENIEKALRALGVDHITFKPSWELVSSLFRAGILNAHVSEKAKKMAFLVGHVCWPCFVMISIFSIRTALEKNIPVIIVGATPGQLRQKETGLLAKYSGIIDVYKTMVLPFLEIIPVVHRNILDLSLIDKIKSLKPKLVPFYEYHHYDEEEILRVVKSVLQWQRPEDTDSCSSNCLINSLGIAMHHKEYNMNPYVIPLAHDVRTGLVSRQKALKDISSDINTAAAKDIARKLGIDFDI